MLNLTKVTKYQQLRFCCFANLVAEGRGRGKLTWMQRISAAIGVARGIQFLHTGIVPGLFSNNLKIIDVLLDHNLAAKISSYNLPFLADYTGKVC